ncbi:hypothetical protein G3M48_003377 [Beauveria asiatica]|uniref:Uncharacterized protein n=1 Tax=Beauveria asiatica TaxID=1069075 RepID=A0AAW0RWQ8_9HYPO
MFTIVRLQAAIRNLMRLAGPDERAYLRRALSELEPCQGLQALSEPLQHEVREQLLWAAQYQARQKYPATYRCPHSDEIVPPLEDDEGIWSRFACEVYEGALTLRSLLGIPERSTWIEVARVSRRQDQDAVTSAAEGVNLTMEDESPEADHTPKARIRASRRSRKIAASFRSGEL